MAFSIAKVGEKARDALPLARFLENVGVLSRTGSNAPEDAPEISSDEAVVGADTAPAPVDGQPAKRATRRLRHALKPRDAFQARLSEWWHGHAPQTTDTGSTAEIDEPLAIHDVDWSVERARVNETLWGEGFLEPGGPAAARKLFVSMMPTSKNTVLDLTAGLGGTAITLAGSQNLWMEAYEPNEILYKRALRTVQLSNLSKQIPIVNLPLDDITIAQRKYDLIYARDRLYTQENKLDLLQRAAAGLKKGGRLLITDFVLRSEEESETLDAWLRDEPELAQPWTLSLYVRALEQYGLTVRARNNLTDDYLADAYAGWNRVINDVADKEFDRGLGDHLLREGEMWVSRSRALEEGELVYCRILAQRS
jgi:cyclopropane fatty-acyl-phospholipid synthase-like methyltransferase